MADRSLALTEPLFQEVVPHGVRCHEKILRAMILSILPLLIGLGFVVSFIPHTFMSGSSRSRAAFGRAGQEPAIDMGWMQLQPARAKPFQFNFLQPARTFPQQSMQPAKAWQNPQPVQPVLTWRSVQPAKAAASASSASLTSEMADELSKQKNDELEPEGLQCNANTRGESGQVTSLASLEEFQSAQRCSGDDRLIVYRFKSKYCKACQLMGVKFAKLAKEFPEVRFFDIDARTNRETFESNGIRSMPYVQMYRGAKGRLDSFLCSSSNVPLLKEKLEKLTMENHSLQPAMVVGA
jgi:thiol-disulfide isomerase/thioredoxin